MKKLTILFFVLIALSACSTDDSTAEENKGEDFDRKAMMANFADNIVIPALDDLDSKLGQLTEDNTEFVAAPDQAKLNTLRASWLEAYKTWQFVEMFNIGKAEELQYSFQMNVYPTNITDIQNNINGIDESQFDQRNYDLSAVNNNDAVGFPAVEYMIYGIAADDTSIVAAYTTDANARKNALYLTDLTNQMYNLTNQVRTDWLNGYRDTFVNSTANNATSALNKIVNDFLFYYERGLRANKIGIPAGVFSTTPLPDRVEGYYSKIHSKELALEALKAVQDFFIGKAYKNSSDGLGFADFTEAVTEVELANMITDQLSVARAQMSLLENDLSNQVTTDNTKMTKTYDELQRAVVLLKVDMLQALNVSVDFVDADGD